MSSASVYPKLLDTDTQLLRRTSTDVVTVADHNNLVDAIENLEATVGGLDDGTGSGGSQTFRTGLADHIGLGSTAINNPRFPFLPLGSNAWYGAMGSTPAAWTLGAGVTADYTKLPGRAVLTYTGSAPFLIASANVSGSAPWWAVISMGSLNPMQTYAQVYQVGFSNDGLGDDTDGFGMFASSGYADGTRSWLNGAQVSTVTANVAPGLMTLAVSVTATEIQWWVRARHGGWVPMRNTPSAAHGTPAKLVIYCSANASPYGPFVLDFITQGNAAPLGL